MLTPRVQLFVLRLLLCLSLTWAGPAAAVDYLDDAAYEETAAEANVPDPIEPFNRAMFAFNDTLYVWVLDPVATGYSKVLPADIRGCISNFFSNLAEPVRSVNCLLQGRFRDSGLALSRFAINSVCGVFGLADPASKEFKIAPVRASLGETLGVWGLGDGFYLVVPVMGSSTLRDFTGDVVDSIARSSYAPWNDDFTTSATVYGSNSINRVSLHLGEYEEMKKLSFDPYIAFRNGYFQLREKKRDHLE